MILSLRRRFGALIRKRPPPMELGKLACGRGDTTGIAKTALTQLASSIDGFSKNLERYYATPGSQDAVKFSSFCSRAMLENATAAILGRLDCFRLLYLSEFQAQPEYDHSKRAATSFSWLGDVMPEEKTPGDLWSMEHNAGKVSRALLSRHTDHVYWKPAVAAMLDFLSTQPADQELLDLRSADPEKFIPTIRGKGLQLYSSLSKGVHWEFFSSVVPLDTDAVKTSRLWRAMNGFAGLNRSRRPRSGKSMSRGRSLTSRAENAARAAGWAAFIARTSR